jgi:hypothetical protein
MKLQHPKRDPSVEVVLEDGRFAKIRRVTRGDVIQAFAAAKGESLLMMAVLVTLTTTIDDEPIQMADWLDADNEFTEPIMVALGKMFDQARANPNKGGVA